MSSVTGEIGYKIGTPANALPWIGGKVINAPPNAIALTLNGAAGMSALSILEGVTTAGTGTTFAASIVTGNASANRGNGLYVQSGASASDAAISVTTAAGTGTLLQIFGDNHGKVGNGLIWSAGGQYNFAQPVGGATVCLIVNGAPSNYALEVQGNTTTGGSFGLEILSGSNANDVAIKIEPANTGQNFFFIAGDGHGTIGANNTVGAQWDANGGFTFQGTGNAQIIIGTSTQYAWGTGTHYPVLQLAGVGALFGTATTGVVLTGGGLYYNGTNYIYGQAGTGIIETLGTGSYTISCVNTSGTAGGTATPTVVFSIGGTVTSNKIQGYGPTAAALVDMTPDTGTFNGTMTGFTTSPTAACVWAKMGNVVVLTIPSTTGSSNSTSWSMGQLPTEIQPARNQNLPVLILEDNGANTAGGLQVATAGNTITFFKGASLTPASWTAAGTKGLPGANTITYLLN